MLESGESVDSCGDMDVESFFGPKQSVIESIGSGTVVAVVVVVVVVVSSMPMKMVQVVVIQSQDLGTLRSAKYLVLNG